MIEYYPFSFHQTWRAQDLHKYSCLVTLLVGIAYLQRQKIKNGQLVPHHTWRETHRKPAASLGEGLKRKKSGSGHHFSSINCLGKVCKSIKNPGPIQTNENWHLHPAIKFSKKSQQQQKAILRCTNVFRQSGSQKNCLKSQMKGTSTQRYEIRT